MSAISILHNNIKISCFEDTAGFFVSGIKKPFSTIAKAKKAIDEMTLEYSKPFFIFREGERIKVRQVGSDLYDMDGSKLNTSYRNLYTDSENNRKLLADIKKYEGKKKLLDAQIEDLRNHLQKFLLK